MADELKKLAFTETELESYSGSAISNLWMVNLYRLHRHKQFSKNLLSLLLTELIGFSLTLILVIPIVLIITQKSMVSGNDGVRFFQVLLIPFLISLAITMGGNIYIWVISKPLVTLANLGDKVDKYNEVIKAVDIIDRLRDAGNSPVNLINREAVMEALLVTRESLVCALKTERIMRENEALIGRNSQLFTNLDNNLTALMALDVSNRASEYGRLLNEALEIGMSVQKEVRRLQDKT
jgi:hypothetical protein